MTIDDTIPGGPKCVDGDVVALDDFGLKGEDSAPLRRL